MVGCRYPCAVKIPRRVRGYAYQTFYRLPGVVRRRIVRLVVPKYLVGAVNIIRDTEAPDPGRLLLLRQPPGRAWGLPAGLLKKYEQPAIGAARELFEESGVRLDPRELTPANPNAIVHALGWVDMIFFGAVPASTTPLAVDGGPLVPGGSTAPAHAEHRATARGVRHRAGRGGHANVRGRPDRRQRRGTPGRRADSHGPERGRAGDHRPGRSLRRPRGSRQARR
jgi:ADP-ribose pyrophosphatase YjhB (NUDIX family)